MNKKIITLYVFGIITLIVSFLMDKVLILFVATNRIPMLNELFIWITHAGSTLAVLFIVTSLFLWEENKQRWIPALWVTMFITLGVVYFLKIIIARPRPFDVLPILALITKTSYSFPSGHTAAAFSALPILDKEFPRLKFFWISFAILVGFSRIYLGVHYFSDVIFSVILALTTGFIIVKIEQKHKYSKWIALSIKEKLST